MLTSTALTFKLEPVQLTAPSFKTLIDSLSPVPAVYPVHFTIALELRLACYVLIQGPMLGARNEFDTPDLNADQGTRGPDTPGSMKICTYRT